MGNGNGTNPPFYPAPAPGVSPPPPPPPQQPSSPAPAPAPPPTLHNAPDSNNQARPRCGKSYTPERRRSFDDLIALVADAEDALSKSGITSVKDQIHALRGIYYGTLWSLDYAGTPDSPGEKSLTRNEGFNHFTRPSASDVASTVPPDVRAILCCGLFEALYNNQDWHDDATQRAIDFGHVVIGLDARFDSAALNANVTYEAKVMGFTVKTVDMGGSGFEVVTWLGDLGGGAGSLSRIRGDGAPASGDILSYVFAKEPPGNSDYGGFINLEGDVGAAVIASGSSTALGTPTAARLSDALRDYLTPGAAWDSRAKAFLSMYGATFDASGVLTNRDTLVRGYAQKVAAFACNYIASRVNDKRITLDKGKAAAFHVVGVANEVAAVFIDTLVAALAPATKIDANKPSVAIPPTSPRATVQSCTEQIDNAKWGRWIPGN
jgi:hypothetical protein